MWTGKSDLAAAPVGKSARRRRAAQITELAESRLRANSYLAMKNLSCDFQDGVLVLRGHLPTYFLKQVAQSAVASLEGVLRIDNQIEVLSSIRNESCHN